MRKIFLKQLILSLELLFFVQHYVAAYSLDASVTPTYFEYLVTFTEDSYVSGYVHFLKGFAVDPYVTVTLAIIPPVFGDIDLKQTGRIHFTNGLMCGNAPYLTLYGGIMDARGPLTFFSDVRVVSRIDFQSDTLINAMGNTIFFDDDEDLLTTRADLFPTRRGSMHITPWRADFYTPIPPVNVRIKNATITDLQDRASDAEPRFAGTYYNGYDPTLIFEDCTLFLGQYRSLVDSSFLDSTVTFSHIGFDFSGRCIITGPKENTMRLDIASTLFFNEASQTQLGPNLDLVFSGTVRSSSGIFETDPLAPNYRLGVDAQLTLEDMIFSCTKVIMLPRTTVKGRVELFPVAYDPSLWTLQLNGDLEIAPGARLIIHDTLIG